MSDEKSKFEEFMQDPEHRRLFEQESLAFEATELIATLMQEQGVKRTELAKRIGKSKAYVTQLLSGSRNMTLHTFADLAFALGHKVEFSLASLDVKTIERDCIRYSVKRPMSLVSQATWEKYENADTGIHFGRDWLPLPGCVETAHAA